MIAKTFMPGGGERRATARIALSLVLVVSALVSTTVAQQAARRSTPSLTSEDLLDRPNIYGPAPVAMERRSTSSSNGYRPVGGLYRDPAGAFSLNLPSANWQVNTRSQEKSRLYDKRVFRKLEADGFASATASVYVHSASTGLPVGRAAEVNALSQRALAEALAARFLSNSASIVSAEPYASGARMGFQVIADQMVSRRAVVRALISAFELDGRLYVVVCRAPLEAFDAQARDFSAITQSLATAAVRSL